MGPGEHRALAWVNVSGGDTIETYDAGARRITRWTEDGDVAWEFTLSFDDNSLVAALGGGFYLSIATAQPLGFPVGTSHIDTTAVSLLQPSDKRAQEIVRLPYQTRFAATLPNGTTIYTPLPLEPHAAYAVSASTIYVGYPDQWKIQRFDITGQELEPITVHDARKPLTDQSRDAWKRPVIDRMPPEQQADMIRYLADLPFSDSLPAFDTLIVDELEHLWVRQFPVPGQDSATWRVFGSDGGEVGRLALRSQQRLFHVGRDYAVIGDTRDDGAEIVAVLRLKR
jgi:hypothetical protein